MDPSRDAPSDDDLETCPVFVGPSPIHARGLFAAREIDADEVLDCGPLLVLPEGEPGDGTALADYVFDLDGVRSCLALGATSLCNHDQAPNAEVTIDVDTLSFTLWALGPIAAGDEILIDYGPEYWHGR